MFVMTKRFLLVLVMLLPALVLIAQEQSDQSVAHSWGVPDEPLNCEMNYQNLEHVSSPSGSPQGSAGSLTPRQSIPEVNLVVR
jgi:hypothetical protein